MTYQEIKERVLQEVPTVCPICGGPLTLSDDLMHLTCDNPDCDGKVTRKLEIAAKALGIDNIGPGVAKELYEHLSVRHVADLFELKLADYMRVPRYQEGMANRLYESVRAVNSVSFAQFIRACQFTRVGEGTSNDIASVYSSLDEFLGASAQDLADRLGGMSLSVAEQIWASVERNKTNVLRLSHLVLIKYKEKKKIAGKVLNCVVTGPLEFGSRPDFQQTFGENYGVKWCSGVSKNTDILVTNETTPTGKFKKAKELQAAGGVIKILTETEFLDLLGVSGASNIDQVRSDVLTESVSNLQSFDGSNVDL